MSISNLRIERHTAKGLKFILEGRGEKTLAFLMGTDKTLLLEAEINKISQAWYLWQMKGVHIQYAFSFLTPEERDFLLLGITPEEWKRMFPDEDSDIQTH